MAGKDPRLQLRGGRWHLRVKVPEALRKAGVIRQREFRKSLQTSDYAEARRLVRIEGVKIDQQIALARRQLEIAALRPLSKSEVQYLALEWFADSETKRLTGKQFDPIGHQERLQDVEMWEAFLSDPSDINCLQTVQRAMQKICRVHGIELNSKSEAFWPLYELMRRGMLEQRRREKQLELQDFSERTGDAFFAQTRDGNESLRVFSLPRYWMHTIASLIAKPFQRNRF